MTSPASQPVVTLESIRVAVGLHKAFKSPDVGRPASVLVPLFVREGRVHVLLTKRTADLSTHAGQISFPGGKREAADVDGRMTALREAHEELGLSPAAVEIIGELDDCPTFVTNFVITPVVGIIPDRYPFVPSKGEIEVLIEAPLDGFTVPGSLRTEHGKRDGEEYRLLYFTVGEHVVWGATARILSQLLVLLGISLESIS